MLCIDTSSLFAFLEGAEGVDVDLVDQAFSRKTGAVPMFTIFKILPPPHLSAAQGL